MKQQIPDKPFPEECKWPKCKHTVFSKKCETCDKVKALEQWHDWYKETEAKGWWN